MAPVERRHLFNKRLVTCGLKRAVGAEFVATLRIFQNEPVTKVLNNVVIGHVESKTGLVEQKQLCVDRLSFLTL